MKVAIYARYSSDNQRDAPIADQLRICREFAARQGWSVVQEFTDHAISGVTLAEGDITHFHIGFKGTMNALFLKDLAEKTHRGPRGRVEASKAGGGLGTTIASCAR